MMTELGNTCNAVMTVPIVSLFLLIQIRILLSLMGIFR